jgi:hypothetical protein
LDDKGDKVTYCPKCEKPLLIKSQVFGKKEYYRGHCSEHGDIGFIPGIEMMHEDEQECPICGEFFFPNRQEPECPHHDIQPKF